MSAIAIGHNSEGYWERMAHFYRDRAEYLAGLIRDPRLGDRHRVVACEIAMRINEDTQTCWPGYKRLVEDAARWGRKYTEAGLKKTITEIRKLNKITTFKKAPEGHKKALAQYQTVRISPEDLEKEITAGVLAIRPKRSGKPNIQAQLPLGDLPTNGNQQVQKAGPEVDPWGNVTPGGNVTSWGNVSLSETIKNQVTKPAEVDPVVPAEVDPVVPTVTLIDEHPSSMQPQAAAQKPPAGAGGASLNKGVESKLLNLIRVDGGLYDDAEAQAILDGILSVYGVGQIEDAFMIASTSKRIGSKFAYFRKVLANERQRAEAEAKARAKSHGHAQGQDAPVVQSRRDKVLAHMFSVYRDGSIGQWLRPFGPKPGMPGCELSQTDQDYVWRMQLRSFGGRLQHYDAMPKAASGAAIRQFMVQFWKIDPMLPNCPIPDNVLAEFAVPRTESQLLAARTEREIFDAKLAAQRDAKRAQQPSSNTGPSSTP